jgi:hypothetical protein
MFYHGPEGEGTQRMQGLPRAPPPHELPAIKRTRTIKHESRTSQINIGKALQLYSLLEQQ